MKLVSMSDFRKLRVWSHAEALVIEARRCSADMRGPMSVTLRDQLLRAAASVPSNIIEGVSHESRREFARFLRYSVASASEVEGHAQLAFDLGMISETDFRSLQGMVIDVRKMLYGLLKRVKQST